MRRKVIAGNWKMHNDINQSLELVDEIKKLLEGKTLNCDVIVCPPFTSLTEISKRLVNSFILLGAQNMYYVSKGAFTGEISAPMLLSAGCKYVILGHSERRTIFNESDELINLKIKKAIEHELKVIFCVGETLSEREAEITKDVVQRQVEKGLEGISASQMKDIIIAYEPVWAIGTGRTATPEQAQEVHEFIRMLIKQRYSESVSANTIIQYGGSVKPDNARELLSQKDIDGALVGGACLQADSFLGIIEAA